MIGFVCVEYKETFLTNVSNHHSQQISKWHSEKHETTY